MGQKASIHGTESRERRSAGEEQKLEESERAILWEVNIARGCLDSFSRMLSAHAVVLSLLITVNLIGFLQPPKGWESWDNTAFMYASSKAVKVFSVANTLSLFTAFSGLLFYIYCSHATIVSLGSVPIPNRFDATGKNVLFMLRDALRQVALPSVRRRCSILFSLLAFSLFFCVMAYISAGIASLPPKQRFIGVILPSIPGCIFCLFFLHIAASKLRLELNFDARFDELWSAVAPGIPQPKMNPLRKSTRDALDPLPAILSWWYSNRGYQGPLLDQTAETPLRPLGEINSDSWH